MWYGTDGWHGQCGVEGAITTVWYGIVCVTCGVVWT